MNRHFIDFWNILRAIPWEEYAIVTLLTFFTYQVMYTLNTRTRYQISLGIFSFLWLFRWVTDTMYHELIHSREQMPFSKLFLPLCGFVFTASMLYEKGSAWVSVKYAFFICAAISLFTLVLI